MTSENANPAEWRGRESCALSFPAEQKVDYGRPRLAPYARQIFRAKRAGRHPNVFCFAGSDAWNLAKHRRRTNGEGTALVLPPGDDPEGFRWPSLDALALIPGDAEGDLIRRLVICLLIAGCRCIVEIRPDQAPACHYAHEDDALEVAA